MVEPASAAPAYSHTPVLLREVLELLRPAQGDTIIDCTAGRGGHACEFAQCLLRGGKAGDAGTILLCDLDAGNLLHAAKVVSTQCAGVRVLTHHGNFAEAARVASERGLKANVVLADLGFSSTQMDDPTRGFSFMRDGPLDMRLDTTSQLTASMLVASASEQELERIFRVYGEERMSRAVARKIVAVRKVAPISTTHEFASVVKAVLPTTGPIHPATRVFQALRIAVNDELGSLDALLAACKDQASWLAAGARVGIISFHSLEDRAVKQAFGELAKNGASASRKPVEASEEELARNPRARSAKLRVLTLGG
jgi:16S rRNA (cytosine1402-N4)-methyltransferase